MSLVTLLGETWDVVDGGTGLLVFWIFSDVIQCEN